jgi:hypothetical protein
MILQTHSYWAYLGVLLLIFSVIIFKLGWFQSKKFTVKEQRLALFTLIIFHIQLLIGLAWYFMSPSYQALKHLGMGDAMKNSQIRLMAVEHPIMMLLAIALITIGYSKHKKRTTDKSKFSTLMWYYGIALLLVLIRIPWQQWFD